MKFVDPGYCFPLDRPRPASFLVAYAYSPSAKRRAKFAEKFPFPHNVWRDFLDAIHRGGEPRVNGEEALRVHRLIDALLDSAAKGAAVHFSPTR